MTVPVDGPRRPPGARSIGQVLDDARARLRRLSPQEAAAALAHPGTAPGVPAGAVARAVLVDIRPAAQRAAEGEIPGALIVERNVLEWRFDPEIDTRVPEAGHDTLVIVVCSEGYTSSLAAASLLDLGVPATDVVGGFQAWRAAGLPTR